MQHLARIALRALRWAALGWLLSAAALAQAGQAALEPSAAVKCLTPAAEVRGEPEYPFVQFKEGTKGRVKLALRFTAPTERPAVEVLSSDGSPDFVQAVQDHVRSYRVPCHDGGDTPVELEFDFVFQPDSRRVHWAAPHDREIGRAHV